MLTCLLLTIICLPSPATQDTAIIDPASILDEIDRLALQKLWPGFDPSQYPIAFYTGESTMLFRHPEPPEDFVRSEEVEGAWVFEGRHPKMVANTSTNIGVVVTATVMLDDLSDRSVAEIAALAVHETFHIFQGERHPDWRANEANLFNYPSTDVENYAASIRAERAFARALESQDEATVVAWAKKALRERYDRMAALQSRHRSYERDTIMKEGTANYVEYLALGKASDTRSLLSGFAPDGVRLRCYSVGRAMAALLDRFAPDWKDKLERWSMLPLSYLLEETFGDIEAAEVDFSDAESREIANYADVRVAELIEERESKRAAFISPKHWKVTVVVEKGANLLALRGFDPMNVLLLNDKEVLHTRMLNLGGTHGTVSMLDPSWTAENEGDLVALSLGVGPHPVFNGIRRVSYAGFPSAPGVKKDGDSVEVSVRGLELKLNGVRVEQKEREIVITLLKEEGQT